jgi:hypothetical protein
MEAKQQISVLDVPFQQVSLDYNTEKKIADREKWQRYTSPTLQKRLSTCKREESDTNYIARTNVVLT